MRTAWIDNARWDVGWLIGSALVVPLVLLGIYAGVASAAIALTVTAVVGGPHLFSTYVVTYLDPSFRRTHAPWLAVTAVVVPALVISLALTNIQVLLSFFIFVASVHVLQQNAYLADVYRTRANLPEARWARFVDYGVLMTSFYPLASFKLVQGTFLLGDIAILLPKPLLNQTTCWVVCATFGAFFILWIGKTLDEIRRNALNGPKTLLIGVTTAIAFFVPALASGPRLELAFQAVNAWHSIQYLGLVSFVLRPRMKPRRLYAGCLAATVVLLFALLSLAKLDPLHLRFEQYYYAGVLSFLLIHYVLDGYLFFAAHREGAAVSRVPYAVALQPA